MPFDLRPRTTRDHQERARPLVALWLFLLCFMLLVMVALTALTDELRRLKAAGHDVFAVNPNLTTFEGEPCWPDLQSIPGGVDGVVIATRPEVAEAIVRDALAAGVRRVWMHASGARGSSVSPAGVDLCRQNGVAVIAGACPMMYGEAVDVGHRCMKWMLTLSGGLPE